MNYELRIDHNTHVRASLRGLDSPDAWIIPNNYELRIMHYELRIIPSILPEKSFLFIILYRIKQRSLLINAKTCN